MFKMTLSKFKPGQSGLARFVLGNVAAVFFLHTALVQAADWQPVPGKMMTRWGREVTPANAWQEYPRPQFERANWQDLNGLWDYSVTAKDAAQPDSWSGKILVPFAVESTLSGVGHLLSPDEALWYHRTVKLNPQSGHHVLLHFEAVDYHTTVWVNGQKVGEHTGGFTPFSFDVTCAVKKGANEVVVRVWDATGGSQLRGKQSLESRRIFYTRVSGIWQTVWLEEVPAQYLASIKITTAIDPASITVAPQLAGATNMVSRVRVTALFGGKQIARVEGTGALQLNIPDAKLWSPAQPNLYDLKVALLDAQGRVVDTVKSYAGIRVVGRKRDAQGNWRFTLNGKTIFEFGTLDQGWWPDGLLTPPSDAAMRWDVDFLKQAGFNLIRKHVKVESRRYYAYCDRVGMLVWQDQVSGGKSPKWARLQPNATEATWSDADNAEWMKELKAMMDELNNAPSIVVWTLFNEAWGEHRAMEIGHWAKAYDPTRLINIASGGNFFPVGDIADNHHYPDPVFPFGQERFNDYIKVVGEFGGHGYRVPGHLWNPDMANWGYGGLPKTQAEYQQRYETSLRALAVLKAKGVAAGVYTQTTDVEGELNGLITYDRAVVKIPAAKLAELRRVLDAPPSDLLAATKVKARFKVSASSSHDDYPPELAVDGDPNTFWHTDWTAGDTLPAHFDLDLGQVKLLRGFNYTPRQDMARGRIERYTVEVSLDGKTWLSWQKEATFPNTTTQQAIRFPKPVQARYLRLTALSDYGQVHQAAIAELEPVADKMTPAVNTPGIVPGFNDQN